MSGSCDCPDAQSATLFFERARVPLFVSLSAARLRSSAATTSARRRIPAFSSSVRHGLPRAVAQPAARRPPRVHDTPFSPARPLTDGAPVSPSEVTVEVVPAPLPGVPVAHAVVALPSPTFAAVAIEDVHDLV